MPRKCSVVEERMRFVIRLKDGETTLGAAARPRAHSPAWPWSALDLGRSFPNHHELIRGNVREPLAEPAGPADFQVSGGGLPQPEMKPPIVRRAVAGLADHLLRL